MTFTLDFAGTSVDFATGADGVGSTIAEAGSAVISVDPDVSADYLGSYVYCSNDLTGDVLFDGDRQGDEGVAFVLPSHESGLVVCDWYFITPAGADEGADDSSAPTTLPSTGIAANETANDSMQFFAILAALALLMGVVARRRFA
ncbi:MAG: hypothetical protein IT336_02805 [Thermomicrobiales bacterium]|nr:hypothetical protein [Thermomicrobiales bacterium]